jgi:hypothetical protein
MKTRCDLLYDLAARLGNPDVLNAELVFEHLRHAGAVCFDDHAGYGLTADADLGAAYEAALQERVEQLRVRMASELGEADEPAGLAAGHPGGGCSAPTGASARRV